MAAMFVRHKSHTTREATKRDEQLVCVGTRPVEPCDDVASTSIDVSHRLYLLTAFDVVVLVDAELVDP